MATHSSILTWRILCIEEPDELNSPLRHKELDMTEAIKHGTAGGEYFLTFSPLMGCSPFSQQI